MALAGSDAELAAELLEKRQDSLSQQLHKLIGASRHIADASSDQPCKIMSEALETEHNMLFQDWEEP